MALKSFWIAHIETRGGLTVRLSGELDMAGAEEVRAFIDTTLARDYAAVGFDCRGVTFIDSIGVKALIHLAQRCAEMGVEPAFRMNARIDRVMTAMGLSSLGELAIKAARLDGLDRAYALDRSAQHCTGLSAHDDVGEVVEIGLLGVDDRKRGTCVLRLERH